MEVDPHIICIDFDGTCVTHEFPAVGKDIGAVPVLKELVEAGHRLVLFTMRSDGQTPYDNVLSDAVQWFSNNGIDLFGINRNPEQDHWTASPKAYGHLYIDDASLGTPLLNNPEISERSFVNWDVVRSMLQEMDYLE